MEFKGYIFITGAAKGIGAETARVFSEKGWFVGLADIDLKGIESLSEELGEAKTFCQQTDITQIQSVKSALDNFSKHTDGKLDILLNNAGILFAGNFEDIALDNYAKLIEVNVFGLVNCIHQAIPILEKSRNPRIINLSSASAIYGIPNLAMYSASKFAVRGLTEALNIELERKGIMVSDIMPSYVNTDMVNNTIDNLGLKKNETLLTPNKIAEQIWKASNSKKIHWYVGFDIKTLSFLLKFLPPKLRKLFTIKATNYK